MPKKKTKGLLHVLELIARYETIHYYLGPNKAMKYANSLEDQDRGIIAAYFRLAEDEEKALLELESMISNINKH